MKIVCLFVIALNCLMVQAQVGIGTVTPSANSALDVTSPDKGIMLPRLADTTTVSNPSAGLMIYDLESAAPAFHDGIKWNNVAARSQQMMGGDSITYTITNPSRMGPGYVAGTFTLSAIAYSTVSGPEGPEKSPIQINKPVDQNSIPFKKALFMGDNPSSMIIEFKVYEPGESTPYLSFKLTAPKIIVFNDGIVSSDMIFYESIVLEGNIYGYKNWITNQSFAYNFTSEELVSY